MQTLYNKNMARTKRPNVETKQRCWSVTVPALEHLEDMVEKTGMQPGQLISFSILALSMGLTRSDYVSALLERGDITLKEAKVGWGIN